MPTVYIKRLNEHIFLTSKNYADFVERFFEDYKMREGKEISLSEKFDIAFSGDNKIVEFITTYIDFHVDIEWYYRISEFYLEEKDATDNAIDLLESFCKLNPSFSISSKVPKDINSLITDSPGEFTTPLILKNQYCLSQNGKFNYTPFNKVPTICSFIFCLDDIVKITGNLSNFRIYFNSFLVLEFVTDKDNDGDTSAVYIRQYFEQSKLNN